MANPVLESFGESPKACVTNSSHPPEKLKSKENPDLQSVCLNYWPPIVALSLCFNHLVLSSFRQCRSAMPKGSAKPIASIHRTVQCPWRNPYVIALVRHSSGTHQALVGHPAGSRWALGRHSAGKYLSFFLYKPFCSFELSLFHILSLSSVYKLVARRGSRWFLGPIF